MVKKKSTVLFVTNVEPFPARGGEYIRVQNVIDALSRNHKLVVISPPIDKDISLYSQVHQWFFVQKDSCTGWNNVNRFLGLLFTRSERKQLILQCIKEHQPEIVWFSWGHWGQYAKVVRNHGCKTVMETHNNESDLKRQQFSFESFGLNKAISWIVFLVQKYHERNLFKYFDLVMSVSEDNNDYHANIVGKERTAIIPNFIKKENFSSIAHEDRENLIVTGNFTTFQNASGVSWFIKEIWPEVKEQHPTIQLIIAGIGSRQLKVIKGDRRIKATGKIESISRWLGKASVAIVPLKYGSGTRVKVLEAMACKTPVISTTLGVEGLILTPGKDVLIADNKSDFIASILSLIQHPEKGQMLAENAYNTLIEKYELSVIQERLDRVSDKLISG